MCMWESVYIILIAIITVCVSIILVFKYDIIFVHNRVQNIVKPFWQHEKTIDFSINHVISFSFF